jgi:hypothetical protein
MSKVPIVVVIRQVPPLHQGGRFLALLECPESTEMTEMYSAAVKEGGRASEKFSGHKFVSSRHKPSKNMDLPG